MHWSKRLRAAMELKGWKTPDLSRATDIPAEQIRKQLSGVVQNPRGETLATLAQALGVTPAWLRYGLETATESQTIKLGPLKALPIRYRVAAGQWIEVDEFVDEPLGWAPMMPDERYGEADQWAELVVGDSFDKEYPDGSIVHVRSAFGFDPSAGEGVVVVVERRRSSFLVERTLKQIVLNKGKVELWPRSTNPRWSAPIKLMDGAKKGEEVQVEIAGIVIGAYIKRA